MTNTGIGIAATREEGMEEAARLVEDVSLTDMRGIMGKRKRDREDAKLRLEIRKELRAELAAHIRAFINRPDLEPKAILQRIADGEDANWMLPDAWPLAWKGLVRIEAHIVCNSNSIPPETSYTISITEKGLSMLDALIPANGG